MLKAGLAALILLSMACTRSEPAGPSMDVPAPAPANPEVILATTTSTQDSGLLDVLIPLFEQRAGYRMKPIAVGTGQALELGARGEADVVLVHAPEAEERWMAQGNGSRRLLVMHNDFVLVGPSEDPGGVQGQASAEGALATIARGRVPFISRGDQSGTHQKELALWATAGVDPKGKPWYQETGQGMGATLTIANEKRAYTLADRATYLALKQPLQLDIVVEGGRGLLNLYHVMPVRPGKFPHVNAAGGEAFAAFLVAPDVQSVIARFGVERFGQPLFFPDAGRSEDTLGG